MLTTLPANPTRLQRLQAQSEAITWLYVVPQPGGLTFEQWQERIGPVQEAIAAELERLQPPRRANKMPPARAA